MKIEELNLKQIQIVENVRDFDKKDVDMADLMQSIKDNGLLQPIGVMKTDKAKVYTILYGHRRFIAHQKLGIKTIQAKIYEKKTLNEQLVFNLLENMQRKNPSAIEEGRIISKLLDFGLSEMEIAVRLSTPISKINRSHVLFKRTPEEFRDTIVNAYGPAKLKAGKIPSSVANKIIAMNKSCGIGKKEVRKMFQLAKVGKLNTQKINLMGSLLKSGLTFDETLEKLKTSQIYTLYIPLNKELIEKNCKKYNMGQMELLSKIIYGKLKLTLKP